MTRRDLPGLKREVARYVLVGLLAIGMGVYILLLPDRNFAKILAGVLLFVGGAYVALAAIPHSRRLAALLRTGECTEMFLTIRGREKMLGKDVVAELRYGATPANAQCDILVFLGYQPALGRIRPATGVKVYGARALAGPVIIELGKQLFWPSMLRSVHRRAQNAAAEARP